MRNSCFLLFLFFSVNLFSQGTEKLIAGKILGEYDLSLPFTTIVKYNNGYMVGGTDSDKSGFFELSVEPVDSLVFSFLGYKSVSKSYEDFNPYLEIKMEEGTLDLMEVVVSGETPERENYWRCLCKNPQPNEYSIDIKVTLEPISWSFYPNPTSDYLNIRMSGYKGNVVWYDLSGRLIKSILSNGTDLKVPVNDLPPATYFLQFETDGWINPIGKVVVLR